MELRNFIDGKFIDSISKKNIPVLNPANQKIVGNIDEALDANPNYIEALLFRGDVYAKRSEWQKALDAYSEVLAKQASASPQVQFAASGAEY